jgi:hypothetical protein
LGKSKNKLPNNKSSRKPIGTSRPMVSQKARRRNDVAGWQRKNHVISAPIGTKNSSRLTV